MILLENSLRYTLNTRTFKYVYVMTVLVYFVSYVAIV